MNFKSLARTAMDKWTKEATEWVYNNAKEGSVEKKVAKWILKKKFNQDESTHHLPNTNNAD